MFHAKVQNNWIIIQTMYGNMELVFVILHDMALLLITELAVAGIQNAEFFNL